MLVRNPNSARYQCNARLLGDLASYLSRCVNIIITYNKMKNANKNCFKVIFLQVHINNRLDCIIKLQ